MSRTNQAPQDIRIRSVPPKTGNPHIRARFLGTIRRRIERIVEQHPDDYRDKVSAELKRAMEVFEKENGEGFEKLEALMMVDGKDEIVGV